MNKKINRNEKRKNNNEQLIRYIYSTIDISNFKYELLKFDNQLSKFIENKYYVSPNFYGKNCFLVFIKIKSRYYSFMIDRKQLSYDIQKVKFDNVFIHHCNVDVDLSIYNGTIFDGIYNKRNNLHEFIITDVYYFKGTEYTNIDLRNKLFEMEMYFDNIGNQIKYSRDKINSKTNLEIVINKLQDIKNIRKLVNEDIKTYVNQKVRGLCFYPDISGTKLIYIFENNNNTNNGNYINKNTNISNNTNSTDLVRSKRLIKKVFIAKHNKPIYAVLEMRATKIVDNYKMYAVEKINTGNNIKLKKCQMDIAYIPDISKSEWCRDITNKSHRGSVFVKCIWKDDKRKWEPLELQKNVKLPSLMEDIRKDIIEMEESDSDSESE
jgi:hypothetical protein